MAGDILDRRRLLQAALALVGASLSADVALALPEAPAARFFDPERYAVLDVVAATIIPRTDTPGARDVGVPARFDAMMRAWASEPTRAGFAQILDAIDGQARTQHGKTIAALAPTPQLAVVAAYDHAQAADPVYRRFKGLILTLFYLSEAGATQELRYEPTPGAWEPSIPVTADTRAWALDVGFSGT